MKRIRRNSELPLDPDVEAFGRTRPLHFQPVHVLIVAIGGVLGTVARYAVTQVWRSPGSGFPLSVLAANLLGSFLLGALLEALVRRGRDEGLRRSLRLLVGTGFCGGFTTYSTLAVGSVLLVRSDHLATALLYDATSVLAGLLASAAGIAAAGAEHRRRQSPSIAEFDDVN